LSARTSFRDPAGYVVVQPDRVLRVVHEAGLLELLQAPAVKAVLASGDLVSTRVLEGCSSTHGCRSRATRTSGPPRCSPRPPR